MSGILTAAKKDTGDEPRTCPWRVFADPFVASVLDAHRFFAKGQLAIWLGGDPPRALLEGVLHYERVTTRLHSKRLEREISERKKAREAQGRRSNTR